MAALAGSAGSGSFNLNYAKIFNVGFNPKVASKVLYLIETYPDSRKIWSVLEELELPAELHSRNHFPEIKAALKLKN